MNPPFCPLLILLGLTCPLHVFAFGSGKVEASCSSMEPKHHSTAQILPAPYNITVSQKTYTAGENITVTLTSNSDTTFFEGFLLEAREASNGDKALGSFVISDPDTQTLNCFNTSNTAVSHTSNKKKTRIQVTWIAPKDTTSDILIKATVAANKLTYWTNVQGPRLSFRGATNGTVTAANNGIINGATNGTISGANSGTVSGANSGTNNGAINGTNNGAINGTSSGSNSGPIIIMNPAVYCGLFMLVALLK